MVNFSRQFAERHLLVFVSLSVREHLCPVSFWETSLRFELHYVREYLCPVSLYFKETGFVETLMYEGGSPLQSVLFLICVLKLYSRSWSKVICSKLLIFPRLPTATCRTSLGAKESELILKN